MKKILFKLSLLVCLVLMTSIVSKAQLTQNWWTTAPPAGKIAIQRLRNVYTNQYIIANTNDAYALSQQLNSTGLNIWAYEGLLGYLQIAPNQYPVYRYHKDGDHYATLSPVAPNGYTLEGILGYASAPTTYPSNGATLFISIYQYYRKKGGKLTHLYANNYTELGGGNSYWGYEGIAFNMFKN